MTMVGWLIHSRLSVVVVLVTATSICNSAAATNSSSPTVEMLKDASAKAARIEKTLMWVTNVLGGPTPTTTTRTTRAPHDYPSVKVVPLHPHLPDLPNPPPTRVHKTQVSSIPPEEKDIKNIDLIGGDIHQPAVTMILQPNMSRPTTLPYPMNAAEGETNVNSAPSEDSKSKEMETNLIGKNASHSLMTGDVTFGEKSNVNTPKDSVNSDQGRYGVISGYSHKHSDGVYSGYHGNSNAKEKNKETTDVRQHQTTENLNETRTRGEETFTSESHGKMKTTGPERGFLVNEKRVTTKESPTNREETLHGIEDIRRSKQGKEEESPLRDRHWSSEKNVNLEDTTVRPSLHLNSKSKTHPRNQTENFRSINEGKSHQTEHSPSHSPKDKRLNNEEKRLKTNGSNFSGDALGRSRELPKHVEKDKEESGIQGKKTIEEERGHLEEKDFVKERTNSSVNTNSGKYSDKDKIQQNDKNEEKVRPNEENINREDKIEREHDKVVDTLSKKHPDEDKMQPSDESEENINKKDDNTEKHVKEEDKLINSEKASEDNKPLQESHGKKIKDNQESIGSEEAESSQRNWKAKKTKDSQKNEDTRRTESMHKKTKEDIGMKASTKTEAPYNKTKEEETKDNKSEELEGKEEDKGSRKEITKVKEEDKESGKEITKVKEEDKEITKVKEEDKESGKEITKVKGEDKEITKVKEEDKNNEKEKKREKVDSKDNKNVEEEIVEDKVSEKNQEENNKNNKEKEAKEEDKDIKKKGIRINKKDTNNQDAKTLKKTRKRRHDETPLEDRKRRIRKGGKEETESELGAKTEMRKRNVKVRQPQQCRTWYTSHNTTHLPPLFPCTQCTPQDRFLKCRQISKSLQALLISSQRLVIDGKPLLEVFSVMEKQVAVFRDEVNKSVVHDLLLKETLDLPEFRARFQQVENAFSKFHRLVEMKAYEISAMKSHQWRMKLSLSIGLGCAFLAILLSLIAVGVKELKKKQRRSEQIPVQSFRESSMAASA